MIAEHIGARSDKGPFRSTNQDAYWVSDVNDPVDLGELYVVTDGVGGQEYGAAAAQLGVQVISTQFYQQRQAGVTIPDALKQAIHQANEAIYEQAQERGGVKMGCTVVAAAQHEGTLHVAHVGDARVYLLHKNKLRQLTRDDSWVQKQVDAGIITPEEAENHRMRNVVTQALGNKLEIEVHQSQHENFRHGDRLLLCTDGLHGVLPDAKMVRLLKNNAPQTAADALVQAAIDAGTQDNVTAVVAELKKRNGRAAGAAAPGGRSLPLWAVVTLITLLLLLLAWGLFVWRPFSGGPDTSNEMALPTIRPTAAILVPDQPTAVPLTNTPEPVPTATLPPPTVAPAPTETATPPLRTAVVNTLAGLWLRSQPGVNSSRLQLLPDGTLVELLPEREEDNNQLVWQKVRLPDSGQEGWVAAEFLQNNE